MFKIEDWSFNDNGDILPDEKNNYAYMSIDKDKSYKYIPNQKKYTNFFTILKSALTKVNIALFNDKNSIYTVRLLDKAYSTICLFYLEGNSFENSITFSFFDKSYYSDFNITLNLNDNTFSEKIEEWFDKTDINIDLLKKVLMPKKNIIKQPFYKDYNIKNLKFESKVYSKEERLKKKEVLNTTLFMISKELNLNKISAINNINYIASNKKKYSGKYIYNTKNILLKPYAFQDTIIHEIMHHIDYYYKYKKIFENDIEIIFIDLYSKIYKNLCELDTIKEIKKYIISSNINNEYYSYLCDQKEIFARVTTQYILDKNSLFNYNDYESKNNQEKLYYFSKKEMEIVNPLIKQIFNSINF